MSEISITIPGVPIAKKRPRFARAGKFVRVFNCQETEEGKARWEISHALNGMDPIPAGTPISLRVVFFMPIPSGMSNRKLDAQCYRHIKKPDLDNLIKMVKDCANGVLWADDSQVFSVDAYKVYDQNPRTELKVEWCSVGLGPVPDIGRP
jgi:Holliday junction resolvase RusA-like endonuclease